MSLFSFWSGPWEKFPYPYNRLDEIWTLIHMVLFLTTPIVWARVFYQLFGRIWASAIIFTVALLTGFGTMFIHPIWVATTFAALFGTDFYRKRKLTWISLIAGAGILSGLMWGVLKKFYGTKLGC